MFNLAGNLVINLVPPDVCSSCFQRSMYVLCSKLIQAYFTFKMNRILEKYLIKNYF